MDPSLSINLVLLQIFPHVSEFPKGISLVAVILVVPASDASSDIEDSPGPLSKFLVLVNNDLQHLYTLVRTHVRTSTRRHRLRNTRDGAFHTSKVLPTSCKALPSR